MTLPLTLLESADLLGRYRYVELAGFSLLGERARRAEGSARLAAFWSGASLAHGFRARCFEERLPVSVGLPGAAACTRSPGEAVEEAFELLGGVGDGALLGALVEVLYPAMLAAWADREAAASPAADPPLLRALRRARDDLSATLGEGRRLRSALAPDGTGSVPEGVEAAVGELLARSGGPFGPLRATA